MDTGASHDFISKHLAAKRRLKTQEFGGFEVIMGNGVLYRCTKIIPQLEVTLGGHTITRNFFVVNLENDIILGMSWINSLGRFTMDSPNREICFQHEGREITLKGIPDSSPKIVSCNKMDKILRHDQGESEA